MSKPNEKKNIYDDWDEFEMKLDRFGLNLNQLFKLNGRVSTLEVDTSFFN